MTPPLQLHINDIILGERLRSTHDGLEELGQSILDNGLIQPIVLVPLVTTNENTGEEYHYLPPTKFGLDAGGRRYHALRHLFETDQWDGQLFHATTSDPARPGFVLKGADEATPLKRLLTEIAENTQRTDPDWRDQLKAIVKAYKLARADANGRGEKCLMQDFGHLLGVGYQKLQAAVKIHDEVIANPTRFKDCLGIRQAYTMMLKDSANYLARLQAEKSLAVPAVSALGGSEHAMPKSNDIIGNIDTQVLPPTVINLSQNFINTDSFAFMKALPDNTFDHIYTDPDYAVSVDRLSASVGGASDGVVQSSVENSLADLTTLLLEAFRIIKPQGFLVLWYDLDHHEKLQTRALEIGFRVQRWPLIWHKSDYRSNASPAHNFCKNMEYAMVCRKPNAILARAQMSSVFHGPSASVQKDFHHPFAKPLDLHRWILSAIAIKGQSVYDPFMGSGSIPVAAAQYGLRPIGTEINIDHYSNCIMNLQRAYKKLLTGEVIFQ